MKKRIVGIIGALIIVLAMLGIILFVIRNSDVPTNNNGNDVVTPGDENANDIPEGWNLYEPEGMGFKIYHPDDVNTRITPDGYAQLFIEGPTQEPNTEFYDGISLVIRPEALQGRTLAEVANEKTSEAPIETIVEEPSSITINSIEGITYTVEGIGTQQHILLPFMNEGAYLHIINTTADPEMQGFNELVNEMLETLELNSKNITLLNNIYMVAIEDNGRIGRQIGCNDSLVSVPAELDQSAPLDVQVASLYSQLLEIDTQQYGAEGYYNALYQSSLNVQSVTVLDDTANVQLSGSLVLGGTCDNPRVEEQLKSVALQFPQINNVNITINNIPLNDLLSGK